MAEGRRRAAGGPDWEASGLLLGLLAPPAGTRSGRTGVNLNTRRDGYWAVESQTIWMHIAPRGAHMPQLALQQ